MFCLCPDGFRGDECETDTSACYIGRGRYYSGTESRSQSRRTCLDWDADITDRFMASDVNSGRHNYCRNPTYRLRPWCYVWKNGGPVKAYCDIPRCDFVPGPALAVPPPTLSPSTETETASTCGQRNRKQTKIVGGTVTTVESHPWVAAIFWSTKTRRQVFVCGGSLIAPCWVLSAAHCFMNRAKVRRLSVFLGKSALNETYESSEQRFQVEELIIHEGFDHSEGSYNHDIALLRLKGHGQCAKETKSVRTVCLPPPGQRLQSGIQCEVAGYGKEQEGLWYKSQYLRQAKVLLISHSVCQDKDYYGSLITGNMFCAGRPDWSQDACEGDSGGPLVCEAGGRLYLFGIVSWGKGCAKEFRPGVYTKVTNYNQWIEAKTGMSSLTAGSMASMAPPK